VRMQTNKRTRVMRALNYRKLGKAEMDMLAEVRVSDVVVGMLFSACSVRSMQRNARARAKARRKRADAHQRTLAALMRKGLLYITETADAQLVHITDTGKELLELSGTYDFQTPRMWDGLWRVVFFDIPQDHAKLRHELRRILERIGFLQVQHSVYAFPHPVSYLERMFTERHFPLSQVTYCTVAMILYDATLRSHFNLPLVHPTKTTNT
jgi:hypothetical protein